MAFKMRSGNKVSFKSMGSSPAKQDVDVTKETDKLISSDSEKLDANKYKYLVLEREEKNRIRKEKEKKEKEEKRPTIEKLRDRAKKEEQDASGGRVLSESNYVQDGDVDKYKSKEQLKQDKKTRRTEAIHGTGKDDVEDRTIFGLGKGKLGTKKYTKAEREANKDAYLQDKLQRQKGTGESGLSFNILDNLLGGSGFSYGPKHKKTQKKIDKRAKKKAAKTLRKAGKAAREKLSPGTVLSRTVDKVRKKAAENKAKKNMIDKNKDNISDLIQPHSITNPVPKGQETVSTTKKAKK